MLYREKTVLMLVARLKEEYDAALARQRAVGERYKEENRVLRAKLSELEGERGHVSEALIAASREGERIRKESGLAAENERRELALLAEKCRLLLDRLLKKYPEEDDTREFEAFVADLNARLGIEEETAFDMDEVISPKEPLDLAKLCRELGLMEENE